MKKEPVIYTVATAHLDTVWNWDFERTVREYIPATLDKNFRLFEKYPEYVFSFEGSRRYELMEEYYPEKFEKLKQYVAAGKWHVTGSAYENGDVNVPSPEALFRNILYGNSYFKEKFGKKSVDIYLPDCFGFGYALPSIIKHSGLKGFTTQKLTWSSAYGIPFDLGLWQGVDGSRIYASLDAQDYSATLTSVREHKNAPKKLEKNMREFDLPMTYLLHGTGDRGGSPTDVSVRTVVQEKRNNKNNGVKVEIAAVDQVFRIMDAELTEAQKAKLPVWNNELVSTDHGVGGYTSRAIGKRWNKQNEQLADAAERMASAAAWAGVSPYPANVLDTAWKRVIAHQFHDDLPGTSLQHCYKRSWNDYALSLNNFAAVYENAVAQITAQMQLPFKEGLLVAVSNPTQWRRTGAVECMPQLPAETEYIQVKDAAGSTVASQLVNGKAVFTADVPANGIALYCITPAQKPFAAKTGLSVGLHGMENKKYKVMLNDNGDIGSVYDKELNRELLKAPVCMVLHKYNGSADWPAWELDYPEVMAPPQAFAASPEFRIAEEGAARVVLETTRRAGESVFVQRLILGEADTVLHIENEIEWRSSRTLLKTPFTFTVSNETASYDLGLGVIQRGLNTPKLYEVPAQNWADISNAEYGVSVLSDCKYGWDHPAADTLRLTGIHTPRGNYRTDSQQSQMELGRNRYAFGLFSHAGADIESTQRAGVEFSQPMRVFSVPQHTGGSLEPVFSFASLSDNGVLIRAIKKAQNGTRIVVRVNEAVGCAHKAVRLKMGVGIEKAWEMLASEDEIGKALVKDGELVFDIAPYAPKTFALELKPAEKPADDNSQEPLRLPYNLCVTSSNKRPKNGVLHGCTIPEELYPETVSCKDVVFKLAAGRERAVKCCGQAIMIPKGCKSVALLMTCTDGDRNTTLRSGDTRCAVAVPDCFEAVGAWDLYSMGEKGYLKTCTLAHEFTHMHNEQGDVIAQQCYLFRVDVSVSDGMLVLPVDERLLVFAAQARFTPPAGRALTALYDTLQKEPFSYRRSVYESNLSRFDGLLNALGKRKLFRGLISKL